MLGNFRTARHEGSEQPLNPRVMSRIRGSFIIYASLLVLAALLYAAWHIHKNYEEAVNSAQKQLIVLATALQSELAAMLGDGNGAVTASHDHFFRHEHDPDALATFLQEDLSGGSYVRGLFIATPGSFVYAERDSNTARRESSWPGWMVCPGPPRSCVIPPITLRSKHYLPVVTRIPWSDGQEHWLGVLYGIGELQALYRRIDMPGGVISLLNTDGILLLRTTAADDEHTPPISPRSVRTGDLFSKVTRSLTGGPPQIAEGVSQLSGEYSIAAVAQVNASVPLIVAVSRPRASVLAGWKQSTRYIVLVTAGVTMLLLTATALLYRFLTVINQREQQFLKLFDTSRFGIMLFRNGKVLHVNAVTREIFRVPGKDIIGLHAWDLSPPAQPSGVSSRVAAREHSATVASKGSATFSWMHRRLDNDEPFEAEVSLSSIQMNGHEVTLAIVHDVSEMALAQRELRDLNATLELRVKQRTREFEDANARLAAANAELEEFTASASHDLRAPLSTISGQASLIEQALGDRSPVQDLPARFARIHQAVRQAADVIDGLLSLARITRQDLRSSTVCMSTIARQILDELRDTDPSRVVHFTCEEDLDVEADARLMKSLLANLIGNAWKYSAGRSPTLIEFGRDKGREDRPYFVRDNGAGFDMAYSNRLFQAFRRLHSAQQFPGTGIGLATAARIIKRYGGSIWAQSAVGQGATFYFTLPHAQPQDLKRLRHSA